MKSRSIRAGRGLARGFTLIELLIAIAITAILLRLAVPAFSDAFLSNKLATYSNSFVASALLARSEAIKRNAAVTLCRSADGLTCATSGTWQQGWIVTTGTAVVQAREALSTDYGFTSSVYSLSFQPSGVSATSTTLTLCRASPSVGSQGRQILISSTGKPSVTATTPTTCATS